VTISEVEATRTAAVYLTGTSAGLSYRTAGIKDVDISRIYAHDSHAPEFGLRTGQQSAPHHSYLDCAACRPGCAGVLFDGFVSQTLCIRNDTGHQVDDAPPPST